MTDITDRGEFFKLLDTPDLMEAAAEVGVAEGRYSEQMLSWGIKKVYMIDLWRFVPGLKGCPDQQVQDANYAICMKRAEAHPDRMVMLQGWSWEEAENIPDESLGLVHIDASHYYEYTKKDLAAYWPKLRRRGVMSGHDYLAEEYTVRQAVDEFTAELGIAVAVDMPTDLVNASFYFRKPG